MCENYTGKPESDNPSSVNVTKYQHISGVWQAKAFTKGLRRWDLTSAVIARFHTKYKTDRGCWEWQASRYPRGYGMVNLGRDMRGKQFTTYAHRVAYVLAHGPLKPGQVVMHRCDNPPCVNPAHLQLGTQGDNIRDAATKGRLSGSKQRGAK